MVATLEVQAIPASTQLALLQQFGPVWRVQHASALDVWVVRAWTALQAIERVGYKLTDVVVVADGYTGFVDDLPTRIAKPLNERKVRVVPVNSCSTCIKGRHGRCNGRSTLKGPIGSRTPVMCDCCGTRRRD